MQPWEIARTFEGVRFVHRGRSRRGIDCVGLLVMVARQLGITLTEPETYGREPARNNNSFDLRWYLEKNLGPPVDRPYQPNDVVMMKLRPRFDPAHVAMVAPHPYGLAIIHTYGEIGRVVYQRIDDRRHQQIIEAFSWANIPAKS